MASYGVITFCQGATVQLPGFKALPDTMYTLVMRIGARRWVLTIGSAYDGGVFPYTTRALVSGGGF